MNHKKIAILAVLLLNLAGQSWAQAGSKTDQGQFHSEVSRLYSFQPHLLNQNQIQSKSDQLDKFWNKITSKPKQYLPLLRKELENSHNSAYFFYDGSKLLLSVSKEKRDRELALKSIPKTDLRDIQPTDYLLTVHWLAANGFDTTNAALRILDYPEFQAFIVQHVLTLGQNYSLVFMLFPMEEDRFVDPLIARLGHEKHNVSQKSILLALWYSVTPRANEAIRKFADDKSRTGDTREYARKLLARKTKSRVTDSKHSVEDMRMERRKAMRRISDEALGEFDGLTALLLASRDRE